RAIVDDNAIRLITARLAFLAVVAALLPASWLGFAGLLRPPQTALSPIGRLDPGSLQLSFVSGGGGQSDCSARLFSPAATETPTPAGIVSGHVTWQGSTQPDPRQVQTATLWLCEYFPPGPLPFSITTDQSGNFSVVTGLHDSS